MLSTVEGEALNALELMLSCIRYSEFDLLNSVYMELLCLISLFLNLKLSERRVKFQDSVEIVGGRVFGGVVTVSW